LGGGNLGDVQGIAELFVAVEREEKKKREKRKRVRPSFRPARGMKLHSLPAEVEKKVLASFPFLVEQRKKKSQIILYSTVREGEKKRRGVSLRRG